MSIQDECALCNDSGELGRDPDGEAVYCTCIAGLRAEIEHCDRLLDAYARAMREAPSEDVRLASCFVQAERNTCMDALIARLRSAYGECWPAPVEVARAAAH